ncbi:MAG: hypothetical protein Q4B48_06290 [Syntrophomonadaceae bacterium]|nr:hypothetical protein [Syntrophomonadaceae bacterium]
MEKHIAFKLEFVKKEMHLMLPLVTSIKLAQNLYEILFQYAVTPDKEALLKAFIQQLEQHVKSKAQTPFSLPLTELEFLEDGLEELQLLNWIQVPVWKFELQTQAANADEFEEVIRELQYFMQCAWQADRECLYVFPSNLV